MNQVYTRRIAFFIKSNHLTVTGGIGQFAKTFIEMCNSMNTFVDIITDQIPGPNFKALSDSLTLNHRVIYPTGLGYSEHAGTFVFSESLNLEMILNFRKSIMKALDTAVYDFMIVNVLEAQYAVYTLGMAKYIPIVFYTHNESSVKLEKTRSMIFNETYVNFIESAMRMSDVIIGTQTAGNVVLIKEKLKNQDVVALPLKITERELLKGPGNTHKDGILFIGRHEDQKNPHEFIRVIKETGYKALVLTNPKGEASFKKTFAEAGISNYEILAGAVGKRKVDFINKARVAYHPSKLETYGYCAYETLHSCPTVLLDENPWWKNFSEFAYVTPKNQAVSLIKELYEKQPVLPLEKLNAYDQQIDVIWQDFFNEYASKEHSLRDTEFSKLVDKDTTVNINKYYREHLKRKQLAVEDVISVLNKRYRFNTLHTSNASFVSKNKTLTEDDMYDGNFLFE